MKQLILTSVGLLLATSWIGEAHAAADKIFVSNNVVTMAPGVRTAKALAVAVDNGKISWIGSAEDMAAQQDSATEIIQLGDRALLPGFIDAHGHLPGVGIFAQLANVASPPVGPVKTMADLIAELKQYVADKEIPEGEWVVGRGYDDSLIAEGRHPTRDDLDLVSTKHPIVIIHVSGHLSATNSRALARVGINAETPDPPGGHIRRRPNSNEPTGVLEETASSAMRQFMMNPGEDPLASVRLALETYAQHGITTAQDGASNPGSIQLMQAADRAGQVMMDIIAYPYGMSEENQVVGAFEYGKYTGRVKVGGVKLMLDGSPQGKTAYLTKPYHVPPLGQDKDYLGYPNVPQARVSHLVATYMDAHVPIIAHANGDAAADMLIEAVTDADPQHDHRTVMIHAQTVREDQLTDMKRLNIVPSYFAAHSFYWGDWHRDSVFGVERASRISPTASTVARGMWFTVHNDAPVVPPDMSRLLWATTNRITRSGQVLGENQRISIYDALRAVTINAAYQHFEDDRKGSIEVGKQADLVILDQNPLAMDSVDLLSLEVVATYSRGEQIYSAANLQNRDDGA